MATVMNRSKTKARTSAAPKPALPLRGASSRPKTALTSPSSPSDRITDLLEEVQELAKRIAGYVDFVADIPKQPGMSTESRERVIAAFHERLVVAEKQLCKVQRDFRL